VWQRQPERFREMLVNRRKRWDDADLGNVLAEMSEMEFMVRFTVSHPDMHTIIVGTSNADHLCQNVTAALQGE
jgi:aryl-alcohol dehydrogenase-like predicted oxidoreductase